MNLAAGQPLGGIMPILFIALSVGGFLAAILVLSKRAARKPVGNAVKDNRKPDQLRMNALAAREEALLGSIREFEARKAARLAAEKAEMDAAITARSTAEERVRELRDVISNLEEDADRKKAHADDLSSDVADLTRTKEALDESITNLLIRQREIEAEMAELDRDVDEKRRKKVAEMEEAVAAQKELAVSKIMAWTESEKSRLRERFENSYQTEATDLRRRMIEKIAAEFDSIHQYFLIFASERKLMVEAEIKDFLAERRSTILSSLE